MSLRVDTGTFTTHAGHVIFEHIVTPRGGFGTGEMATYYTVEGHEPEDGDFTPIAELTIERAMQDAEECDGGCA